MIRISITAQAFDAIAKTLPLGSVAYEAGANAKGQQMICLDDRMADRLGAMRQPVERWGEVIRLVWSG
jgi:hypothetical protein